MAVNYDNSAWFYDRLSRLVYGRALINAQVFLLKQIPANSSILIVGGGTGWILDELSAIYPKGLHITYVEVSEKMTALSRKRNVAENKITFINDPVQQVHFSEKFDVVVTPFLFDNFTAESATAIFIHLHKTLKPGGLWLNADFQLTGKWWQKLLLKTMMIFFRILCGVETTKLPDMESLFTCYGYRLNEKQTFFGDFVVSGVYKGR